MQATLASPPARSSRAETLVIAAVIPAIVACLGWWLRFDLVAVVAAGGVLAGPVVAYRRADRAAGPSWARTAVVLGVQAPLVAGAVISVLAMAASIPEALRSPSAVGSSFFAFVYVMPIALVFGTPISVPVALVAGWLAHRAASMERERARRHVGALAAGAIGVAIVTLVAVAGLAGGIGQVDWPAAGAAVRLTMSIENRGPYRDLEVGWLDADGGESGVLTGAPGCAISTDRYELGGRAWSVTFTDADGMPLVGPPLVVAADWPGSDPELTVRIDVDGTVTAIAGSQGQGAVDAEPLPLPLAPCAPWGR